MPRLLIRYAFATGLALIVLIALFTRSWVATGIASAVHIAIFAFLISGVIKRTVLSEPERDPESERLEEQARQVPAEGPRDPEANRLERLKRARTS